MEELSLTLLLLRISLPGLRYAARCQTFEMCQWKHANPEVLILHKP